MIATIFKTSIALLIFIFNTLVCGGLIILLSPFKLGLPFTKAQIVIHSAASSIVDAWVSINNFNMNLTQDIRWQIEGLDNLDKNGWYFVLANHQSTLDIVVLQRLFCRKIPFLKFFIKKELLWVPLLGQCWWMLDFPSVKRNKSFSIKNKGTKTTKDFTTTRTICNKLQENPSSITLFLEGTRITKEKRKKDLFRYNNLLRPKAGGFALVLETIGNKIDKIIDVTIVYPNGPKGLISLFCGKVKHIIIQVKQHNVTNKLIGKYELDPIYRKNIQNYLNHLWEEKDQLIDSIHARCT